MFELSNSNEKIAKEVKREAMRLVQEAAYGASRIALENLGVRHFDQGEAEQRIWTEISKMMEHDDWPNCKVVR